MTRFLVCALFVLSFIGMEIPHADAAPITIAGVTASEVPEPENVPENTFDGDLSTRWSAKGDGHWLQYELEGCATVGLVRIAWHQGDRRTARFAIEVSDGGDAPEWWLVHSGTNSGDTLDLQEINIPDSDSICHIRILTLGNSQNDWNSITEVVFEGPSGPDPVDPPLPILGVIASGDDGNVPGNTIDRDLNTRWSALGDGQWIEFDLGRGEPLFNQVSIAWYQGDGRSFTFAIEILSIEGDWWRIYGGYSSGTTLELQPHDFVIHQARYVRIVGFGNSRNDWNSITEVEFRDTIN
jgi:poly(beta-D-mannuronate) lyase